MNRDDWERKSRAILHDPPAKFDARWYKGTDSDGAVHRGHEGLAEKLADLVDLEPQTKDDATAKKLADWWTSSADRPQLGYAPRVCVGWRQKPLVTHPLDHAPLCPMPADRTGLMPRDVLTHVQNTVERALGALEQPPSTPDLTESTFWWLWRSFRNRLQSEAPPGVSSEVWRSYVGLGPADTRAPDHNLWDHVRLASALAYGPEHGKPETHPWLFTLGVGPVGAWIRETRTTRDLWVASMLLSEVSLAAMQPVIEAHGPDSILYPDLAANLRFDREIARRPDATGLLGEEELRARTRAALIPNRWMALIRQLPGDDNIQALGERCRRAALARWTKLASDVQEKFFGWAAEKGLLSEEDHESLSRAWAEHCAREGELFVHWAARPWAPPEALTAAPAEAPALPGQGALSQRHDDWVAATKARMERFGGAVTEADHYRYDRVRWTYQDMGVRSHIQPGYDYALTQHALKAALASRDLARTIATEPSPAGDACTLCGRRPALGAVGVTTNAQRDEAGKLWAKLARELRWDEAGTERLCGVCATRRFLVPPWKAMIPDEGDNSALARFHHVWAPPPEESPDRRLHLPMPSTAAVAAAPYLTWLYAQTDGRAVAARKRVGDLAARTWPRTFYTQSLHAVHGSMSRDEGVFSELEPSILYPGPRLAELTAREIGSERNKSERQRASRNARKTDRDLGDAVSDLPGLGRRSPGSDTPPERPPDDSRLSSRIAVIALDGDRLGRLLRGHPESVRATWADVLHPDARRQIEEAAAAHAAGDTSREWATRWVDLLNDVRLMGPSLHAFINRAVTTFANRIVPWVVEREFAGRLVYAGGDDVLALAPARDALGIAARLQQLWSAAWIQDSRPGESAWGLVRRQGGRPGESVWVRPPWDPEADRERFRVAAITEGESWSPGAPVFVQHAWTRETPPSLSEGEILPMLGRHQSLSAGIAYAHFKTPLHLVVDAARAALEDRAKGAGGRAACAEVLFTRSGAKYHSVFRWDGGDGLLRGQSMAQAVKDIRGELVRDELPSRLPYKVRADAAALRALATSPDALRRMAWGLVTRALGDACKSPDTPRVRRLVALWLEGLRAAHGEETDGRGDDLGTGNLLLSRALANEEEEA